MTSTAKPIDPRGCRRTLHGPSWRRRLALSLCTKSTRSTQRSGPTGSPRRHDDAAIREYCDYLEQAARQGTAAARAKFPLVAQAELLEHDPARREAAMIMVMGDIAAEEMGDRLAIPPAAIELWEALNFDVRDLRHAIAWIWADVIRPEQKAGRTQLAARLKLALMAGPEAARALVSCELSGPVDEAERLFQRNLKLQAKVDEAADLPLRSERETLAVLRLPVEIKRLASAKAKLAEQCTKAARATRAKGTASEAPSGARRRSTLAAGGRRREAARHAERERAHGAGPGGPGRWRGSGRPVAVGPAPVAVARKARRPAPSGGQFSSPRRTAGHRQTPAGGSSANRPPAAEDTTGPALPGRWRMTAAMRSQSTCNPTRGATSRRPRRQATWS